MKKIILLSLAILLPTRSYAEGQYDGIWQSPEGAYITVVEHSGTVVAAFNFTGNARWSAFTGILNGNKVRLNTLIGNGAQMVIDVTLHTSNDATANIVSCTPYPGYTCKFPSETLTAKKVW